MNDNTSFLATGISGIANGFGLNQTMGVEGRSNSTQGIGVLGIATTFGYPVYLNNSGVVGLADNGNGVFGASLSSYCFYGLKQNFPSFTGTVARFENQNAANTSPVLQVVATGSQPALEINNGFIKVSGTNKSAFTITAVTGFGGNTAGNITTLSYTGMASTDILIITHNWQSNYIGAVGTYWSGSTWAIFREDGPLATMHNGEKFNVMVIKK